MMKLVNIFQILRKINQILSFIDSLQNTICFINVTIFRSVNLFETASSFQNAQLLTLTFNALDFTYFCHNSSPIWDEKTKIKQREKKNETLKFSHAENGRKCSSCSVFQLLAKQKLLLEQKLQFIIKIKSKVSS